MLKIFFNRAPILGQMEGVTQGNGRIIICMGSEFTLGQMGDAMKGNTTTTRSMALGSIFGQMEDNI